MRFVGSALAGLLLGVMPASAQYLDVPRPPIAIGPALLDSAAEIVDAMGLEPVGPAIRSGAFLVQRATDDFGRVLRVTIDARRSQVIAVEALGAPRGIEPGYSSYGPYRGPYARGGSDDGFAPPGSIMSAREPYGALPRPRSASIAPDLPTPPIPGKPRTRSAAVTPQHPLSTPTPRKRPSTAPREAAGSVEPIAPQAPAAPAAAPQAAPAAPPAKPDGSAMPPVVPLE